MSRPNAVNIYHIDRVRKVYFFLDHNMSIRRVEAKNRELQIIRRIKTGKRIDNGEDRKQ
jgi:hypothetical protein